MECAFPPAMILPSDNRAGHYDTYKTCNPLTFSRLRQPKQFNHPPGYPKLLGDGTTVNDPQIRSAEERTGTAHNKQTLHTLSITYLKVRDFRLRAFLCVPLFVLNFALRKGK